MRVDCENCGAQYKIPSHKLVKEVNKATCRKCGHRMLIKKTGEGPALPPSPEPPPVSGNDEQTVITGQASAAMAAAVSEAQARAVAAFPEAPEINEWEDDQPTKIRSAADPANDNRPTAPGSDLPPTLDTASSDGEPTQILNEPTAPEPIPAPRPRRSAAPAPQVSQQTRPRRGYDPAPDLTWAIVGTLAAIVGVLLLAANLSGSNIQRFFGLLLSLGGTFATLFILVTGGRGSKKASLLIATLLSVILSLGGATALNLLHVGYASWSTPEVATNTPAEPTPAAVTAAADPEPEPVEEPAVEEPSAEDLLASAELTPPEPEPVEEPEPTAVPEPSTPAIASSTPVPEPEPEPAPVTRPPPEPEEDDLDELFTAAAEPEPEPEPSRSAESVLLPTVVDTILRNNKGVKRCFQYEYKRAGSVPRSLPVGFKVRSSGSVSSAWVSSDSYKGTELESCLKGAILAVQFPPFDGDSKTMSYTFRL